MRAESAGISPVRLRYPPCSGWRRGDIMGELLSVLLFTAFVDIFGLVATGVYAHHHDK